MGIFRGFRTTSQRDHAPHQGAQEKARRVRQALSGQLGDDAYFAARNYQDNPPQGIIRRTFGRLLGR